MSKRKGFNFYASYYDVFNELEKDKDKVEFIQALLDRQFLGKEPEGLKGLSKFAYISQKHSIDQQVKGWEDKTGEKLTPSEGGEQGGSSTPTQQEQVQGEVQVQEKGKGKGQGIEERKVDFWQNLLSRIDHYEESLLREFYEYWTESSPKARKMRWEKEKAFDIDRRLRTWVKRAQQFKVNTNESRIDQIKGF